MQNSVFVANVQKIADSNPVYRTGGDGSDGTCDCVGLIIGSLGQKYDLHSSNYFARSQMRTLDSLVDESQLHAGSIVYKSRRDTSQLHERYQAGGRYYNGDLLDYYHVGVVTAIEPVEITHCTSSGNINGIAYDTSIKPWTHFGELLDVDADKLEVSETLKFVKAASGKSVNVRIRPDKNSPKIFEVPLKESVVVTEEADGWSKIRYNGLSGYMMSQYLVDIEEDEGETVAISKELAEALYQALGQFFN